ncbi:hypothetical protein [Streptomyces sp. NPDC007904]|uniref:hypothetical protein n=1 Tax=Streptomyces sp. NPDC007904 TaxID=3364787 RepID=UPI0036EF41F5
MVFGTSDSGAANPARADGTTLLDEIRAGAPFGGGAAPVARARSAAASWGSAGPLSAEDGDTVVRTARRATSASWSRSADRPVGRKIFPER